MNRRAVLAFTLVAACKKETVQRAPPTAVSADAAVAPAAPQASKWIDLSLSLITLFPKGLEAKVFPLADGIAVMGLSEITGWWWNVVTLADRAGAIPVDVSGRLPMKPGDQIRYLAGTTDEVWFGTDTKLSYHAVRPDAGRGHAQQLPRRHRLAGELRPGQWIALESHAETNGIFEESPVKFELLAGQGELPTVRPEERIHEVVFLGGGRMCGLAMVYPDEWHSVWFAEADGATGNAPINTGHFPGITHVFRASDGSCVLAMTPHSNDRVTILHRLRTGLFGPAIEVPFRFDEASFAPDGSMWNIPDVGQSSFERLELVGDRVDRQRYALPEKVAGCDVAGPLSIAGRSDRDVWVVVWCKQGRAALLSSRPSATPQVIATWPSP